MGSSWACAARLGGGRRRTARTRVYLTFSDVTEKAGLLRTGWSCGVCVGDDDNDGFEGLFIACGSENVLYHNKGDGTFIDVTRKAGVDRNRTHWGSGCTWIDYDRNAA